MTTTARNNARNVLDKRFATIRPIKQYAVPPKGWIRAIRDAMGMTRAQFADRLNMSAQGVSKLENSEANDTVRLNTLRKAAEALDCSLIYALVPNASLEEKVHTRMRKIALRALGRVSHTMALEDQSVRDDELENRIDRFMRESIRDKDLWNKT